MISYVPARYADARRKYYAAQLDEQKEARRGLVAGALFFE